MLAEVLRFAIHIMEPPMKPLYTATFALVCLLASFAAPNLAQAQQQSAASANSAGKADEKNVRADLTFINARLNAVYAEMQRRMLCQQNSQVSNATSCVDVPGLASGAATRGGF
jgi:hypothetical protein